MNPNIVATLMESAGKHQVVLKPLMGSADYGQDDEQPRPASHRSRAHAAAMKAAGLEGATHNQMVEYGYEKFQADIKRIEAEMMAKTPHARPEQRVLEVDYIAPLPSNEEIMMAGIGPGRFQTYTTGMSQTQLVSRRHNTDFYESVKFVAAPNQFRTDRGVYVITRKFQKLLTMNAHNIVSIDGKPLMGLGDASKGASQLGQFDEAVDPTMQPQQPKAPYHIVMRRGTIIDADYVAQLIDRTGQTSDTIYMVGIGKGPGEPHLSRLRHPIPNNHDFWHPTHYRPSNPNAPCEIDEEGFHNHPDGDPHHTDYYTVPKFQRVITMHAKNIRTINGKAVFDVSDTDPGVSHLDLDEWTIGDITDTLEE